MGVNDSKPSDFYIHLGRGLDLVRMRDILEFWRAVCTGERVLRLPDLETMKIAATTIAAARSGMDTTMMQLIDEANHIDKMILTPKSPPSASPALRGLILGEAHRLFDDNLELDDRVPTIPARMAVSITCRPDSTRRHGSPMSDRV